ncbi:NAD(P)-binding protein [Trichoderma citrinoviride]|uniref:NAD(P)-binding protein n=1 Tax=Trichoderma citrinoviride TaxID=58853 RepID=A0A2T4B1T0_9HYPO|nr:NAD(P)-binding protein [Trichoderma citrinoviride]PTB63282.1 NAD(P)-binding protein [Trichoderma citrinoviride]
MAVIKNVAIAGASGNIGAHVLRALLEANFNVTVLTRSQTSNDYGAQVKVVEADFNSVRELTAALKDQDAVISTLGKSGLEKQTLLIDAAIAAGVYRFIPSEFGSCTTSPKVADLPFYSTLASVRSHLMEKATTSALTYSIIAPGCFMEYFLAFPAAIDFKNRSVAFMDGGNTRVSVTSLATFARAVAAVLNHPEETKNRVVYISEAILTQRQLLDIAKKVKPEIQWTTSDIKSADILKAGLDAIASGGDILQAYGQILVGTVFGEEYGSVFDKNDNSLLGIETLTEERLKALIADRLD